MNGRAERLHSVLDAQLTELIGSLAEAEPGDLRRSLPGRQKLGDGTVGVLASHTADNYGRIAAFVAGHGPGGAHGASAVDSADASALVRQLVGVRSQAEVIAQLTDAQLQAVPAAGRFRFCDGERSLEEVLRALLRHQEHQVAAIGAALG
jgi:hypothetical protein